MNHSICWFASSQDISLSALHESTHRLIIRYLFSEMTVAIWFENKRVLFFKCILLTVLCHIVLHSIQLLCILLWQILFWYKGKWMLNSRERTGFRSNYCCIIEVFKRTGKFFKFSWLLFFFLAHILFYNFQLFSFIKLYSEVLLKKSCTTFSRQIA